MEDLKESIDALTEAVETLSAVIHEAHDTSVSLKSFMQETFGYDQAFRKTLDELVLNIKRLNNTIADSNR
jgi:hypothetical protein